ncbi:MAG TPA: hypothetical protein VFZ09_01230 [Archangium sp.]|nr:hypothetical protein [Archangium sp.]HEX5744831.1 hypothetical protein [Archangium sp.]
MDKGSFSTGHIIAAVITGLALGVGGTAAYFIMTSDEPESDKSKLTAGK